MYSYSIQKRLNKHTLYTAYILVVVCVRFDNFQVLQSHVLEANNRATVARKFHLRAKRHAKRFFYVIKLANGVRVLFFKA